MSTRKGVWNLQQVRDKYLQSLWVNDHSLWSWGRNEYGVLGLNQATPTEYSSPVQVGSDITWKASGSGQNENRFTSSAYGRFAIKEDGTLWSWGGNTDGQLGQNNTTSYSSPKQVGSDTTWSSLSGGWKAMAAVKTDGTLWIWGNNGYGELGQNSQVQYSSPIQIPGTDWSSASSGAANFMARKTNGTLWSWGYGTHGRLAQNNNIAHSSPVQIPGTNWSEQYTMMQTTMTAIKTDGTLWAWGRNYEGQLGQNQAHAQRNAASSPIQVGSGSDWEILAKASAHKTRNPIVIKTDGSLWIWGSNEYGQLAQNNRTNYSSPVQVPGTWSTTVKPTGNEYGRSIFVVKSDGSLWSWGRNQSGGLGQNAPDNSHLSSPVQIPGSSIWGDISATGVDSGASGIKVGLTPSQL